MVLVVSPEQDQAQPGRAAAQHRVELVGVALPCRRAAASSVRLDSLGQGVAQGHVEVRAVHCAGGCRSCRGGFRVPVVAEQAAAAPAASAQVAATAMTTAAPCTVQTPMRPGMLSV
jgi:hypothetical protein